ncbi:XK-related protein 6 [Zerene cesonia]|uniref:XK-related protein 6 n=1 Tax=Zerene cesonia TaxID=33412 RepID=UPI0018E568BE|nr:XK-related protein 6 [Zerene cesonia]
MPKAFSEMLENGHSYDEPDRMPNNITITYLDILMYVVAIIGHFVDLGLDINVAVQYCLANRMLEFGWTLIFILLPAFVNTAVSVRMYSQDKQQNSLSNEFTKRKWLRIFILVLQMAPILRFADALIYAIKSRRAERKRDQASQRMYYSLMLKEDSDAALLRIFECFLEAAPQQVLQMSILMRQFSDADRDLFAVHQILSICSSIVGMGWCLAAYQRAIRFAQQDKSNITWCGTVLQVLWHFLVTLSRITSLSIIAYLFPYWTILACAIHILIMTTWLQLLEQSAFCAQNKFGEVFFSLALGGVYLFTYILPVEGRTRYRYTMFYSLCFVQNVICGVVWFIYAGNDLNVSIFFYPILVLSVVPYVFGLVFMIIYYRFFHPKVSVSLSVSFKGDEAEISS